MTNVVPLVTPTRDLDEFFTFLYGEQRGFVYCPTKDPVTDEWHQDFFDWPLDKDALINHVLVNTEKREVYYGPAMYKKPQSGKKDNILGSYVLWTEFDGTAPDSYGNIPIPSMKVRSSESGHEHVYWRLDYFEVDSDTLERANKSLTYSLHADTSAWDVTQVLRPIHTVNHKRNKSVELIVRNRVTVSVDFFEQLPEIPQVVRENISVDDVPEALNVVARYKWEDEAWTFFRKNEIPTGSRSSAMMRLAYYCAEMQMSDEEAFSILYNADDRWGKFKKRQDRTRRLLDLINRARLKYPIDGQEVAEAEYPIFYFQDFLDTEVTVEWIIPGVLQDAGSVLLTGPPGTGKTQMSLQFAIHMALGKDFMGWEIRRARKVAFFSLEMGHADLKFFVDQMALELIEEEKTLLQANLLLLPIGEGILLDNSAEQVRVNRFLQTYQPDGIIFDSLSVTTDEDMSSETTAKGIYKYVNHIRNVHGVFVWFIHHNRKSQVNNKKPNKLSDVYGNFMFTAQPTTVISLWPVGQDALEVNGLKVRLAKQFSFTVERNEYLNFVKSEFLNSPLVVGEVLDEPKRTVAELLADTKPSGVRPLLEF